MIPRSWSTLFSALALSVALPGSTLAHGDDPHEGIGQSADPNLIAPIRTVLVDMGDVYFQPTSIRVFEGETIRFVVTNSGAIMHEFNIGNSAMHAAHEEEMMMMMEQGILAADHIHHELMSEAAMSHDDPNSVLLEPGETAEVAWTFPVSGDLQFACNVPGHYVAGMVGDFNIGSDI